MDSIFISVVKPFICSSLLYISPLFSLRKKKTLNPFLPGARERIFSQYSLLCELCIYGPLCLWCVTVCLDAVMFSLRFNGKGPHWERDMGLLLSSIGFCDDKSCWVHAWIFNKNTSHGASQNLTSLAPHSLYLVLSLSLHCSCHCLHNPLQCPFVQLSY